MADTVQFINSLSGANQSAHTHSHEHGGPSHDHGGEHGHTHEILDHPGRCRYTNTRLTEVHLALIKQGDLPNAICRTTARATLRREDSRSALEGACSPISLRDEIVTTPRNQACGVRKDGTHTRALPEAAQ